MTVQMPNAGNEIWQSVYKNLKRNICLSIFAL